MSTCGALAPDGGRGTHTLRVALDPGRGGAGPAQSGSTPRYAAQFAATADVAANDGGRAPLLVVWPEDVVSAQHTHRRNQIEKQLSALAKALHSTLVVGVTETVSATRFRNEIVAFSPAGKLVARFEKVHRVPFGEYIPYRGFFKHLANLSSVPLDAIPRAMATACCTHRWDHSGRSCPTRSSMPHGRRRNHAGAGCSSIRPTRRRTSLARCRPRRSRRLASRPSKKGATWSRPRPPASTR